MKLLFTGDPGCSAQTLKRLMIIGEELAFMDRPSVTVGGWTMIGINSPLRQFEPAMQDTQPSLKVYTPPVGPISPLHEEYARRDLANPAFRGAFLRGLQTSDDFAFKFLQLKADYGPPAGTGENIRQALLNDPALEEAEISGPRLQGRPFQIDTANGRLDTLRMLLTEASVRLTGTLAVASETGLLPVADDPIIAELFAMRSSGKEYVGGTASLAPWLGLEVATAVVPDEALAKLNYTDILDYRKTAKDAYNNWFVTINKWASEIDAMTPAEVAKHLQKLQAEKINPSIIEYRSEMKAIAEKLWGDLLKTFARYPIPALSLGYVFDFSPAKLLMTAAAALSPAIPALVDYLQANRNLDRKHASAYLIGITEKSLS
jgi:hypothetical protein